MSLFIMSPMPPPPPCCPNSDGMPPAAAATAGVAAPPVATAAAAVVVPEDVDAGAELRTKTEVTRENAVQIRHAAKTI